MSDVFFNIVDLEEFERELISKVIILEKEESKFFEKVCINRKFRNGEKYFKFIIVCVLNC